MGKWINTDAAYAVLTDYYHHTTDTQHTALREALGRVETVDAVEVVRCKDCKFYHRMTAETGICKLACRHLGNDGFCSEGERKEGNGNE